MYQAENQKELSTPKMKVSNKGSSRVEYHETAYREKRIVDIKNDGQKYT